jgi:hypothetical protein
VREIVGVYNKRHTPHLLDTVGEEISRDMRKLGLGLLSVALSLRIVICLTTCVGELVRNAVVMEIAAIATWIMTCHLELACFQRFDSQGVDKSRFSFCPAMFFRRVWRTVSHLLPSCVRETADAYHQLRMSDISGVDTVFGVTTGPSRTPR